MMPYHSKVGTLKKKIKNDWPFMKQDKIIGEYLPNVPKFVFRKNRTTGFLLALTIKDKRCIGI